MAFRPGDSKREEFRKYLEKSGILDAMTKALVSLYEEPEKPVDALDYFRKNLKVEPDLVELEAMKLELFELKEKMEQLTLENKELKEQGSHKVETSNDEGGDVAVDDQA